eukprot:jgi/Ulvmu1/9636/UM054_0068.1
MTHASCDMRHFFWDIIHFCGEISHNCWLHLEACPSVHAVCKPAVLQRVDRAATQLNTTPAYSRRRPSFVLHSAFRQFCSRVVQNCRFSSSLWLHDHALSGQSEHGPCSIACNREGSRGLCRQVHREQGMLKDTHTARTLCIQRATVFPCTTASSSTRKLTVEPLGYRNSILAALTNMYGRQNLGNSVSIDYKDQIGTGSFKNVYRGVYREGPRSNQPCVQKLVRPGAGDADFIFDNEQAIVDKAVELIQRFNDIDVWAVAVYLNMPTTMKAPGGALGLVEPYIRQFEKYNSNSGWVPDSNAHRFLAMQALSHFSYHSSGGHFLLCDLQGGRFNKGLALTDPVIMSNSRRFGPTDLGREGMLAFFSNHVCNQFCMNHWQRPRGRSSVVPLRKGTSAMARTGQMLLPPSVGGAQMYIIEEADEDYYSSDDGYWGAY